MSRVAVLVLLLAFLAPGCGREDPKETTDWRGIAEVYERGFSRCNAESDSLKRELAREKRFRPRGISTDSIAADLARHPEVIPLKFEGEPPFAFHGREIYVLSSRWVYARFDNGHVSGSILLEYSKREDGSLKWKILDAYQGW